LRNAVKYRPFLSQGQDIDDQDPLADPNVGNGLILVNPITLANAEYRRRSTDVFNLTLNASYNITKTLFSDQRLDTTRTILLTGNSAIPLLHTQ
jgi:hypothetical protein